MEYFIPHNFIQTTFAKEKLKDKLPPELLEKISCLDDAIAITAEYLSDRIKKIRELLAIIKMTQEFVGTRASNEERISFQAEIYIPPKTEGEILRLQADKADRQDRLILLIREILKEGENVKYDTNR